MKSLYIGIDNGTTGTIGFIGTGMERLVMMEKMPIKVEQDYTQKNQKITRVDFPELLNLLERFDRNNCLAIIENPMENSGKFKSTGSALRCLEAVMIACEKLCIGMEFKSSRKWQNVMLPKGIKGSTELKKASRDIGIRLFPECKVIIEKHGDADGLLIAEWARRIDL